MATGGYLFYFAARRHYFAVPGRIQIRAYDDSYGNRRKATELIAEDVRFLARSGHSAAAAAADEIPY